MVLADVFSNRDLQRSHASGSAVPYRLSQSMEPMRRLADLTVGLGGRVEDGSQKPRTAKMRSA